MLNFYLLSSAASSSAIFCKPGGTPIWPVLSDAAAAASSFAFSSGDLIAYLKKAITECSLLTSSGRIPDFKTSN